MNEFWKYWKNKSSIERSLIKELVSAKSLFETELKVLEAIYVKGSFQRREIVKGSDLDLVLVYKIDMYDDNVKNLKEKLKQFKLNKINLSAYSLKELFEGKTKLGKNTKRFSKHLYQFKLLFGVNLNRYKLRIRSDEEDLEKLIGAFHTIFLPKYASGEMSFQEIVKQVFWLTDNELRYIKIKPKNKWCLLVKQALKVDEGHIVGDALKYRFAGKNISVNEKKEFMVKLSKYLF